MRHRLFIFNSNSKVRSVIWICLFLVMVLVAMNLLANKMEVKDSEKKYYDWQMQLSIQNSLTVRIQIKISVAQWLQ